MTALVSMLPAPAQRYAKALTAALVSALTVLTSVLDDAPGWMPVVLAVLTAPVVYAVPNLDPKAEAQDESVMPPEASPDGELPLQDGEWR